MQGCGPSSSLLCNILFFPATFVVVVAVLLFLNPFHCTSTATGFNTRLSSAGLVYKHFGREVVTKLMAKFSAERAEREAGGGAASSGDASIAPPMPSDDDVETVFLAVYKNFMEAVDAIDNGVDQYENAGEPRYISQTNLSARVGGLNPYVSVFGFFFVFGSFRDAREEREGDGERARSPPFLSPPFLLSLFLASSLPLLLSFSLSVFPLFLSFSLSLFPLFPLFLSFSLSLFLSFLSFLFLSSKKEKKEIKLEERSGISESSPKSLLSPREKKTRMKLKKKKWNEDQSDEAVDAAFERAVELTALDFEDAVRYVVLAWLPARALVVAALDGASDVDGARGEIIELPTPCPWKEHLLQLEKERDIAGRIKFVVFEDARAQNWRVQAVPAAVGGFGNRVDLPCKGLRDTELDGAAALLDPPAPPGGVFVHVAGFIGGHATREGALCYARAALKAVEEGKAAAP